MNTRKFYLVLSVLLLIFLFFGGSFILTNMDTLVKENNVFSSVFSMFKSANEPVNILVLGGDKVNKNTDTIMLVNFNPKTEKINLISIPRDTKIKVKGSSLPKINSAYPAGGINRAVDTVSTLVNVEIKYYIFIDTSTFRKIIDLLGGVDINIPANMDYDDPIQNLHIHLKKGQTHLDGAHAEQFMRFRHPTHYTKEISKYYDGSDLKRIDAQQNFIKEVIRQKANIQTLAKINEIISVIFKNVETNLTVNDALKMAQSASKMDAGSLNMLTLPGDAKDEGGVSYYIYDKAKAADIIKQYFNLK